MKSKKDRESFRSNLFSIFEEAVGCCQHPGASDLQELKKGLEINDKIWKAHQGGAALGVDLIFYLVLVPEQRCYPGVGVLLVTIDILSRTL